MSAGHSEDLDGGGLARALPPFSPWPAGLRGMAEVAGVAEVAEVAEAAGVASAPGVACRRHADGGGAPIGDPEEDEGYGDDDDEDDDLDEEDDDEEPWQVRQ